MATVNIDSSTRLDIVCKRGDSFLLEIDFGKEMPKVDSDNPTKYGEYTMRVAKDNGSAPIGGLSFQVTTNTSNNIDHSLVKIEEAANQISGASFPPGLYVYELAVTDRGNNDGSTGYIYPQVDGADRVLTLLYGTFKINDDLGA